MSQIARVLVLFLIVIVTGSSLSAQEPSPGPFSRLVGRIRQHRHGAGTVQSAAPAAAAAPACKCAPGADPYGFEGVLNRIRASAGLNPVTYDPELSTWASQNNAEQCRRGIGHHVNPCAVQNCGWNFTDANSVAQGWMKSPGHRRNMLAPGITHFGIAFGPGPYWTLNGR